MHACSRGQALRFHAQRPLPLRHRNRPARVPERFCAEPFQGRTHGDGAPPASRPDIVTIRDCSSRSPSIEVLNARSSQIDKLHHYRSASAAFGSIRPTISGNSGPQMWAESTSRTDRSDRPPCVGIAPPIAIAEWMAGAFGKPASAQRVMHMAREYRYPRCGRRALLLVTRVPLVAIITGIPRVPATTLCAPVAQPWEERRRCRKLGLKVSSQYAR